ncbi:hypothetical protein K435DRAFT_778626 [Dendrothele bispora CBS 962.96]|uniref:Uncharacterized protein n=1 Tax=Dendrothele bispora (strain CBS 962.96) TaxID=1314807 RepID=A0A4S8M2D2_DENBC|nr:hypothetical protein K435DRAFT_778626 [Dendrothele bispora CBS 962.96]
MSTITKTEPEHPLSLYVKSTEYALDDLPAKSPEELVYLAVKKLTSINVELINFRSTLYRRMNVPLIISNYTYLVPDEFLFKASCALLELGLPIGQPASFVLRTEGDFMKLGKIHRITRSTTPGEVRYLILLPSSFASFAPEELHKIPVCPPKALLDHGPVYISSPRPSAVYAFLFRALARYPRAAPTRHDLLSDLAELIRYDMYKLMGYNEEGDDEDSDDYDPQDDPVIQDALERVREWSRVGEWRKGEEWIGDCLGAVVEGKGRVGLVPWK